MKRFFTSLCVLALSFAGATVASAQIYYANEDFASITKGNNTNTSGSSSPWTTENPNFPVSGRSAVYSAGNAVRVGTKKSGFLTTATLDLSGNGGNFVVEFDVKGWTNVEGSLIVSVTGFEDQTISYTATMDSPFENKKLYYVGGKENSTVKITATKRAFLDNIKIYPAYEVKVSSAKYATLATDKAYVLPSNLTGNVVTVSGQTASVTPLAPQAKVAAQQGILLKGDEGTYYMQIAEEGETFANNELKPALENGTISVAGKKHYILANDPTKGIGFYFQGESGDGSSVSNLAGKAYLAVDANVAPTQGFSFSGIVSSIDAATVAPAKNEVYDLSGRRVSAPVKGLYIVNGKKVIR